MKDWRLFFWVCEDSRTSDLCLSSPFLCLSSLCLSCHSCLSLSLSPSPPLSLSLSLSLMSLSNIHDTFAIPPSPPPLRPPLFLCPPLSLLSPRFSLSSFCLIAFSLVGVSRVACGVRAARCQSRRVLGVSRVLRSHRVVRSLASSHRLSSRVVCRLAVRRPGLPVRRPSCSMSVASCAELFQSRLVVRRPAGRCQSRRVLSPATLSC